MIVFFSEKVFLKLAVMVTTCNSWKFAAIDWLFEDSTNEIFKNNRFSLQKFYCDVIALFEFLRYSLLPIGQMSVGSQEERLWYNVYGICCSVQEARIFLEVFYNFYENVIMTNRRKSKSWFITWIFDTNNTSNYHSDRNVGLLVFQVFKKKLNFGLVFFIQYSTSSTTFFIFFSKYYFWENFW